MAGKSLILTNHSVRTGLWTASTPQPRGDFTDDLLVFCRYLADCASVLALLLLVTSSCPGRGLFFTAFALLASAFQAALESLDFTDVDVFSGGQILSGSEV